MDNVIGNVTKCTNLIFLHIDLQYLYNLISLFLLGKMIFLI